MTIQTPISPSAPARVKRHAAPAFFHSPTAVIGGAIVAVLALMAIASIVGIAGEPSQQIPGERFQAPSLSHWFGTDQFGRDLFARVSSGIANSLLVSVVAVAVATVIGTVAGIAAGYLRGVSDSIIGAITNVLFAFPSLLLALTLASVFKRNWFTVAIAIAIVYIPIFIRVTRGPVLSLREVEYIGAAKAMGMSASGIMLRHVLPNIGGLLVVQIMLSLSWAVLTEASLSFLGFGTPPPAASLGSMVYDAQTLVVGAPWMLFIPGGVVILLIVGLNLLGDGLRDVLDPNSRGH